MSKVQDCEFGVGGKHVCGQQVLGYIYLGAGDIVHDSWWKSLIR